MKPKRAATFKEKILLKLLGKARRDYNAIQKKDLELMREFRDFKCRRTVLRVGFEKKAA